MSNEPTNIPNIPGIDNLTPFEYALAGVPAPDGQDAPSLAVIKEMRALAKEVEHAPISQRRLQEFLLTGSAKQRNDRRSVRTRRSTSATAPRGAPANLPDEGGFIDITPIEIAQDGMLDAEAANGLSTKDALAAAAFTETSEMAAPGGTSTTNISPLTDSSPSSGAFDPVDDAVLAEEPAADAPPAPIDGPEFEKTSPAAPLAGLAATAATGLDDPTGEMSTPNLAAADAESPEILSAFDVPPAPIAEAPAVPDIPPAPDLLNAAANDLSPDLDLTDTETDLDRLFPDVEDDPDFHTVAAFDHVPPAPELASAPLLSGADHGDDDDAVLVAAGSSGMAGILDHEEHEVRGSAGAAASMTPVPIQRRRLGGGAFWALAGTAVGAAVLGLGGMLWATGLGDDGGSATETAAESQATTTTAIDDTPSSTVAAAADEERPTSTEDTQSQDSRSSGSGDFGQLGSSTTLDPSTTLTEDPDTTSASASDSTDPPATAQTTTTIETTTTELATTRAPTTEAPATTVAPPVTVPETTAPVLTTESTVSGPLAFIGDSVNIGSFGGPPAVGALVALFNDTNGDGQPHSLNQTRTTNNAGRYAFNVEAGCYVVRFYPIDNHTIDPGLELQPLCVERGQAAARIDGIVYPVQAVSAPPSGCYVEPQGGERQGVEVYENNSDWADSYTFYANDGSVVVRTRDLGPPDDIDSPTDHEWMAASNGFNHRAVRRIAAERNGVLSEQITCSR